MRLLEKSGQTLSAHELKMVIYRQGHGLMMKVFCRRRRMQARDDTETVVLHCLKLTDVGRFKIWREDWRRVIDDWHPQRLIRTQHVFLRVSPVSASESLQHLVFGSQLVHDRFDMRAKGKVRVKCYPKDFRVLVERQQGALIEDLWVVVMLVGVGGEEGVA